MNRRSGFPASPQELVEDGGRFWDEVRKLKDEAGLPGGAWYPYESLSSLPILAELMAPIFEDIAAAVASGAVADIGCGDGDWAMLFAHWGAEVDAIDYAPNNYNGMRGIARLGQLLDLPVQAHNIDLDSRPELPRNEYGLGLLLGTLYHLKNPYALLEKLAYATRWCLLSTRIAQVTPKAQVRMEEEPLAYLASGGEIGNDATNYWIFSACGLLRILQRTRWAIASMKRAGCVCESNPVASDRDERMFVLLQSRVFDPELQVRLLDGWHQVEEDGWRWTAKRFALEVVLPLEQPVSEFVLSAEIPEGLVSRSHGIGISCHIGGECVGSATFNAAGPVEFRGKLPPFALHEPILRLDFMVENASAGFCGDLRELGICVPLAEPGRRRTARIPFRVR